MGRNQDLASQEQHPRRHGLETHKRPSKGTTGSVMAQLGNAASPELTFVRLDLPMPFLFLCHLDPSIALHGDSGVLLLAR